MKKLILALILLAGIACAAEEARIGVYVINAGNFNPQSGSYLADFYLSYACSSNCTPNFEFSNGRAVSTDVIIDRPNEKFYRIQAALQDPVDFRRFPFDAHNLTIEIEDKTSTTKDLVYIVDSNQSGMDPSIGIIGWNVKGWNASVEDHYYQPYGETYSTYRFTINIEREILSSLLKIFVPVFFIMLLNFFAHFLGPQDITTRITLHSSLLIAAVMFHVAVGNQLPSIGYLTVADKFMFVAYLPIALSLLSAIAILELKERKRVALMNTIDEKSGIVSLTLWLAGLAFVILTL